MGFSGGTTGSGWQDRDDVRRLWAIVSVVLGVLLLGAALSTVEEDVRGAVVFAATGAPLLLFPWFIERREHSPYDYEGRHGAGLALPLRPLSWALVAALTVWGLLLLGIASVALAPALSDGDGPGAGVVVSAVLGVILGVAFLAVAVSGVHSRLMRDRMILLTVDGVVLNPPSGTVRMPWHAVAAFERFWRLNPGKSPLRYDDRVSNYLVVRMADAALVDGATPLSAFAGLPDPVLNRDQVAMDPDVAVAVLTYYLEHPEERAELRTVVWKDRVAAITRSVGEPPVA